MTTIKIKPLSVNECWQGRRFKTPEYSNYERTLLFMLPKIKLPLKPYFVSIELGLSNVAADIDNPIKPILDILQKKYDFNDKDIYGLLIKKEVVKKGDEYFKFSIYNGL